MSAKSASESQFDHIDPSTLALLFSAKLCSLLLRQNNNSEKSVAKVFVLVAAEIESCERFGSDRRQNSNKRQKLRIANYATRERMSRFVRYARNYFGACGARWPLLLKSQDKVHTVAPFSRYLAYSRLRKMPLLGNLGRRSPVLSA